MAALRRSRVAIDSGDGVGVVMTQEPQRTGPPIRWRLIGVVSGVGPGLIVAGIARLVGELGASAVGLPAGVLSVAGVVLLLAGLSIVLALAARRGRPAGTRESGPAIVAFALTALVGAALLPGVVAAVLAIGIGVVVRTGVGLTAGLERQRQTRPSK